MRFYGLLFLCAAGMTALAGYIHADENPSPVISATGRAEYTRPAPLLDPEGNLSAWGWARRAFMQYNRDVIPKERRGRIKEWEHYTIMSPEFTIGLTMAQLGSVSFGSFEVIEYPGGIKPGGFFLKNGTNAASVFTDNPYGTTTLSAGQSTMTFEFAGKTRRLSFKFIQGEGKPVIEGEIELTDDPADESVAITRPFSEPGHFFYENKIFGMAARGSAKVDDRTYTLPDGNAWAIYDWGRGIWPHECSWFWGQAAGMADGRRIAFNLGHGYGDDAKGTCNAILHEGRLHKLESVSLDFDPADRMKPWRITETNGRLDLDFKPIYLQHAHQEVFIAATELHKVHGLFTGTLVLDNGRKVRVENLLGFMEHADHKW